MNNVKMNKVKLINSYIHKFFYITMFISAINYNQCFVEIKRYIDSETIDACCTK